MQIRHLISQSVAVLALGSLALVPVMAGAQGSHRQEQKNNWRNLSIASGAAGLLGLLKGDNTLFFAGAAGALYSANRYEQDRKSQDRHEHARYQMFSRTSFTRDGHRYVRHTKMQHGQKYYYFSRDR